MEYIHIEKGRIEVKAGGREGMLSLMHSYVRREEGRKWDNSQTGRQASAVRYHLMYNNNCGHTAYTSSR